MKRNVKIVVFLIAILLLNIVFTQYMVHQYFYEQYSNALLAAVINVLLFPIAYFVYKNNKRRQKGVSSK